MEEDHAFLVGATKRVRTPHTEGDTAAKASADHDSLVSRNSRNDFDFLDDFDFLLNLDLFDDLNLLDNLYFLLNLNLFDDLDLPHNLHFLLNDDRLDNRLGLGTAACDRKADCRQYRQQQQASASFCHIEFQVPTSVKGLVFYVQSRPFAATGESFEP